jgi:putative transposase
LQRRVRLYRRGGLADLARQTRADRGRRRRLPGPLPQFIEGRALQTPPPSAATVHRQVVEVATRHDLPSPSYSTVSAGMAGLEPARLSRAHDGRKVYADTFDLLHRREAEPPNAIWQADHTPLDIPLQPNNDCIHACTAPAWQDRRAVIGWAKHGRNSL